jgi:alkylated DNA repair dioxygenase AlkB
VGKSCLLEMKPIVIESFLDAAEAQQLFAAIEQLSWTRGKFRGGPVPREEVWIGPYPYRFSGRTLQPARWIPEIETLRHKIQRHYDGDYNSVLLNRYVNERDGVSWHSDDEPEMDSEHPIASVSLGAARIFQVRPIGSKDAQSYLLTSGSLLLMPAGFQQKYEHRIPKSQAPCGTRINLTFRRMKRSDVID